MLVHQWEVPVKAFFQSLREFLWTLIAVLAAVALFVAVALPAQFAGHLAGIFDELESVGFDIKIKTPIGEASFQQVKQQQLVTSDQQILELRDELADAARTIALLEFAQSESGGGDGDGGSWDDSDRGSRGGGLLGGAIGEPDMQPGLEIIAPPPVIVPAPVVEQAPEQWVVIAGAERDLASQRAELDALHRAGLTDAVILKTGGWYQSAVIYSDRAAARTALAAVSEVVGANRGAYIRALSVLCPDRSASETEPDVYTCN